MNKYSHFSIIAALVFLTTGCAEHYMSVCKVPIDRSSLASTYAESPNPQAKNPPKGEKLYVTWRLPFSIDPKGMKIRLKVIYKDLTEAETVHPIPHRVGAFGYAVLNEKFIETNGFYSYKAELLDKEDKIVDVVKQRMWVNVINLKNVE